nr:hypothetical protein [Tanacetum cinerariifolium]
MSTEKEFMIISWAWKVICKSQSNYTDFHIPCKHEKRVMIIKEIPKFCDATLKRVLEKVKKFNLYVKHSYANPDPSDQDAEYMKFYEEYIQERLRHQDKMRR